MLMLAGCEIIYGQGCPQEASPAVRIIVRDSVSAEPLSEPAGWLSRDGQEFQMAGFGNTLSGGAQPGTYAVRVERNGYRSWERSMTVRATDCGVETAEATARLQPVP